MELTYEQSKQISSILNSLDSTHEQDSWDCRNQSNGEDAEVISNGSIKCESCFNEDGIITSFCIKYIVKLKRFEDDYSMSGNCKYRLDVDFENNSYTEYSVPQYGFTYIMENDFSFLDDDDMQDDDTDSEWYVNEEYDIDPEDFIIDVRFNDSGNESCESIIETAITQIKKIVNNE